MGLTGQLAAVRQHAWGEEHCTNGADAAALAQQQQEQHPNGSTAGEQQPGEDSGEPRAGGVPVYVMLPLDTVSGGSRSARMVAREDSDQQERWQEAASGFDQ